MIKHIKNKSGQAMIVVLMICLFLGIISCAILNFQSSQINLLSKSAREYIALSCAETGLHCVLAEMKADYQFVTHGNPYIPTNPGEWPSPVARKYNYVGSSKLLKTKGNSNGVYEGSVEFPGMRLKGDFKVRIKLIKSLNSTASKSVDEAHRYFLLESYGKVGDSYRKISTIIEKFVPGNFLLYDGQVLDVGGYGPYRVTRGLMKSGRLYGHEMIIFSKRGGTDATADLEKIEKISTPGYIKSQVPIDVEFFGGKKGTINPRNDSTDPEHFETFSIKQGGKVTDRFMLDGNHGGKPQMLPPLNPTYYREAKKPHPEILKQGSSFPGFSESKWRNPEKPNETVYDLFFGWKYEKEDTNFLIYSEVPLRVWGCPKWKALTIFCEKDVYIAGDLNANPDSPQRYRPGYREYEKQVRNGTDKNGLQIMSMGRIWFDYSNPMNFLRNEMAVVIDYDIGCALTTSEPSNTVLKTVVWPERNSTGPLKGRMPMSMLNFTHVNTIYNMPKEEAKSAAAITALAGAHPALYKLRAYFNKPGETNDPGLTAINDATGGNVGNVGDLGNIGGNLGGSGNSSSGGSSGGSSNINENISRAQFADDGGSVGGAIGGAVGDAAGDMGLPTEYMEQQKVFFPIRKTILKLKIAETIGAEAYWGGMILPATRDSLIKQVLDAAEEEMNNADKPDPDAGAWNMADRIFALQVKHKDTGLRFPEMTVNAILVDSAVLNAKWNFGNDEGKVNNELGNIQNDAMRSLPWAKDKNTRMILRHHGSMIHLRNRPVKEYIKGAYRDDQPIIRQISFDPTYASGGGDYFPPYPIAGFTIINWQDEFSSEEEYKKVK